MTDLWSCHAFTCRLCAHVWITTNIRERGKKESGTSAEVEKEAPWWRGGWRRRPAAFRTNLVSLELGVVFRKSHSSLVLCFCNRSYAPHSEANRHCHIGSHTQTHTITMCVHIGSVWYRISTHSGSPLVHIVSSMLTAVGVSLLCPHSVIIYQPSAAEKVQESDVDEQVMEGAIRDKGKRDGAWKESCQLSVFPLKSLYLRHTEITLITPQRAALEERFLLPLKCMVKQNQQHVNRHHSVVMFFLNLEIRAPHRLHVFTGSVQRSHSGVLPHLKT